MLEALQDGVHWGAAPYPTSQPLLQVTQACPVPAGWRWRGGIQLLNPKDWRGDGASRKLPSFPNCPLLGAVGYRRWHYPGAGDSNFRPPALLWCLNPSPKTLPALVVPHSSSQVESPWGGGQETTRRTLLAPNLPS